MSKKTSQTAVKDQLGKALETLGLAMKTQPPSTKASSASARKAVKISPAKWEWFKAFNDFGEPDLIKAKKATMQFVRDMASSNVSGYWLTLTGPSGTGKTMLARIVNRIFQSCFDLYTDERFRGNEVVLRKGGFKSWPSAINEMRDGDYSGQHQLKSDWFAVLDDIGAENRGASDFGIGKLYDVLNARLGLWTVITVNLDLEAIGAKMDTRIASRLLRHESAVCNIGTHVPDYNRR